MLIRTKNKNGEKENGFCKESKIEITCYKVGRK